MVEGDAAERFLSAPMWADVDRDLRRALFEAMDEDRRPPGQRCSIKGKPTSASCS